MRLYKCHALKVSSHVGKCSIFAIQHEPESAFKFVLTIISVSALNIF